jgi:hypothetical protein
MLFLFERKNQKKCLSDSEIPRINSEPFLDVNII